jgi:hypothetical protein
MRHLQKKINKHIISVINPKYEFYFTGLDAMTPKDELELLEKKVKTFMMIDEIRAEKNLEPLPNGAGQTILDSSMISAATQKEQMKYGFGGGMEGGEEGGEEGGGDDYITADEYDTGDEAEKAFDDLLINFIS